MRLGATLLHNAVGYDGDKLIPGSTPHTGLRTRLNRGFYLSAPIVSWPASDSWVYNNIRQGLTPVACIVCPAQYDQAARNAHFRMLAERYGRSKHVRIWEIDNEFDTAGYWSYGREKEQGVNWRNAHDIFKSVDPDCVVILGSIQSIGPEGEGLARLNPALAAFTGGPWGYCPDAVSAHVYPGPAFSVAGITERVQQIRGVMIANGAGAARLWITEFGYMPTGKTTFADLSAANQQAWLVSAVNALKAGKADVALYWQFDDPSRANLGFGFDDWSVGNTIWNNLYTLTGCEL